MRIGLFGGTFDPFHFGHLHVMCQAQQQGQLDVIYVAPNHVPSHKTGALTTLHYHRYAMTCLAIEEYEYAIPIMLATSGFTCDEIRTLQRMHPDSQIYMIMGQDAFLGLPQWREFQFITDSVSFLVYPRGNIIASSLRHPTLRWMAGNRTGISATEVRERIKNKQSLWEIPRRVREYIFKTKLYATQDGTVQTKVTGK